jgi:ABC-2 type transport system permease protein
MKRYFKLFIALINISSKQYLEHRWNVLGIILLTSLSVILTLLFLEFYFSYSDKLYGWTKHQAFFLSGVYNIVAALFSFLFLRSINMLQAIVRNGDLDLILVKPAYSQFLVSFRYIRSFSLLNTIPGLLLTIYATSKLDLSISFFDVILLIINLAFGILILYGIYFSMVTSVFWLSSNTAVHTYYSIMEQFISVPTDIFGKTVGFILTFVMPLALIVTIPVKIFFDSNLIFLTFVEFIVASLILMFSIWFWKFALRYYTSASS